ncbi:MAG: aspartate aminotransferase family protein [Bdellovibrionota bacterium]
MKNKTQQLLTRLAKVECPDTTFLGEKFPIVMKRGRGLNVVDVDNRNYLDFTSCFGVLALGHTPAIIKHAMQKQAKHLIHGMGDVHPTEEKIKLLELLAKISPYENPKSILGLSGGDAIEAALKTSMLATGRYQFLSFAGGYHGLQFAPLALNNRNSFIAGFEPWLEGKCVTLPFPYFKGEILCENARPDESFFAQKHKLESPQVILTQLEDHLKTKQFAALVLEPIQGRGGKREFTREFLESCAFLCKKYGTLLVFDEIFTGFGRTGKMFALEHSQIIPDLLCVGKAMGGGLPLSACVGEILDVWGKSKGEARHTQTFLGHPLACAVAYKNVLEIQKKFPKFQNEMKFIENEFHKFVTLMQESGLSKKYPFELKGKGLMRGFWFYTQKEGFCVTLMERLLESGFIVLPDGPRADVLSMTPPLITEAKHVKMFLKELFRVLDKI